MPIFHLNKLVRDKLPEVYEDLDQQAEIKTLSEGELLGALLAKIAEEIKELDAASSKEEMTNELADVQQAIDDLLKLKNITREQVSEAQVEKQEEKGGFLQGFFVKSLVLKEDDPWVAYYRKDPEKYPESGE